MELEESLRTGLKESLRMELKESLRMELEESLRIEHEESLGKEGEEHQQDMQRRSSEPCNSSEPTLGDTSLQGDRTQYVKANSAHRLA
jgi:hypothetical protein